MTDPARYGASDTEVDGQHPFPGLLAFRERESVFFFGRQEEAEQLLRLVRRDVATLLFGGSGIGKSSLIHAGLFPLLRQNGLLPVPIRVDFAANAPRPVTQVKAAVRATVAASSGEIECPGLDWDAATLWELLHRAVLWSPTNRLLQPVLVFDQFEELFTIGAGSAAAADLVVELEDLISNQVPESLQRRLEEGGGTIDLPHERQDFRVLVSLREDFLPLLEGLCDDIPLLRRNRMRITALSPEQALQAVCCPNPALVDEAVGREIVRFVADAEEHPFRRVGEHGVGSRPEVEPALLSLVCRELNASRIAQGRDRITSDLLSSAKVGILADFYDRSLADLPAQVRVFVEDHLLTRSGYRNMVAMDDALETEGIVKEHLAKLIDRRLIRVEDRLGAQRIELTHDVLTRTIRKSRDSRRARTRERQRLDRERQEVEQRQRELEEERERQRRRNRRLAWLVAGLGGAAIATLVVAALVVVLGVLAFRSAREADGQRQIAENALAFMLFDLRDMVESTGRLDIVERAAEEVLAQTAQGDPEELPAGVARLREVAHIALGDVRRAQGDLYAARASYDAATAIALYLSAEDPENVLWQRDLSVVRMRLGDLALQEGDLSGALSSWSEEERISRWLADRDPSNLERQRELSLSAIRVGNVLSLQGRVVETAAAYRSAHDILARLVAAEPANVQWASDMANVLELRAALAEGEGDFAGAASDYRNALEIRRDLAGRDGSNLLWQSLLAGVETALGRLVLMEGDLDGARSLIEAAEGRWAKAVERDPASADWQAGRAAGLAARSELLRFGGDLAGALRALDERLATLERLAAGAPSSASLLYELAATHAWMARLEMLSGQPTKALAAALRSQTLAETLSARDPSNAGAGRLAAACRQLVGDALVATGDPTGAVARYRDTLADMERMRQAHPDSVLFAVDVVDSANRLSHALWLAGDTAQARDAWQEAATGLRALEIRSEISARRALDGPLGAIVGCTVFRKPPDEGAALGIAEVEPAGASRKVRAGVLGFQARRALFEGSPESAVDLSQKALAIDPTQTWLQLGLAHGQLLGGHAEAARELYLRYRYFPVSDALTFREAALEDFEALRDAGVSPPAVAEVGRILGSP